MSQDAIHEPATKSSGEKVLLGIAAASAIVTAAAISGLPACTCASMALTYEAGIGTFGMVSLTALTYLGMIHLGKKFLPRSRKGIDVVAFAFMALMIVLFTGASLASVRNLYRATLFCNVGTEAEIAAHQHQRIVLNGFLSVWGDAWRDQGKFADHPRIEIVR